MGIVTGGATQNLLPVAVFCRADEIEILLMMRLGMGFPYILGRGVFAGSEVDQVLVPADAGRHHLIVFVDRLIIIEEPLRPRMALPADD